ncbi:MAG TPA: type II/IV secretion system protein [Gemmatimonadales bacterium]|nr:type II/IV secretion system protein [Gemmatimonadales bacterium]
MQFTDEWLVPTIEPLLPEGTLAAVRAEAANRPTSLWDAVVQRKLLADDQVLSALAGRFRFPVVPNVPADPAVKEVVSEAVIRRFNVLPFRLTDSHLEVATSSPFDIDAEKVLAFTSGREVRLFLASPSRIREGLAELYPSEDAVARLLGGLDQSAEVQQLDDDSDDIGASAEEASHAPIVRLVDMMIADGIASRASDIHVEPVDGGVAVRYRIDGVLRQVMKIPRSAGIPLISRVKIMSGLDIADRRRPQDGRARVSVNGSPIDLRISTLPAASGEKVVIRVLNTRATLLSLEALGLFEDERQQIVQLLDHKEGILLVTGPTGSGKTTTLYSALRLVQGEGINIVTVEDPVEYKLGENIVQVQVQEKAGLTFASALRSILRQDPDVVLVGEIRDHETAQIAVQASLTGHLVLSTLHTNDAANAVTRLVDMGIEPYKLASALRGVVAQRLMRRLCTSCRTVSTTPLGPKLRRHVPEGTKLYAPVGCPECAMTGYRGRFSIVEVLAITPEIERLIGSGATADRLAEVARAGGMRALWESGLRHILSGETSAEELLRVTDVPADRRSSRPLAEAEPPRAAAPPVAAPKAPASNGYAAPDLIGSFDLIDELEPGNGAGAPTRGKVLLVEDEEPLRKVMRDLLEREGYSVAEAADGVAALDQVDRVAPDVIMLDLNLPGLDGYHVLQQLRSRPATSRIPVIVLTAKGDEDNEVRVFQLGADDFLTKPFRARALSARLDAVLSRTRS